ncbi:MAG TPA: LemA family protein [Candidatus Polarisedimenticolia bacterium]|jgi:LemA protein|nr:LemA family protein [Candidatus Polarisedimenticolia bacterium]
MGIVVLIGLVVLTVIAVGYLIGIYNQLVQIKVNVDKSWANIEVLEKQRYDEIPKLVKVCEGYMQYERGTLEKVIEARSRFLQAKGPADMAQAGAEMGGALKSLFALAEAYPDLKANQNFTQLQQRVSALENEIADRREFYNESVTINNARIQQVPYVFLAGTLSMTQREMYKVAPAEKESPEIKFAMPA